jgi:hypothetical protein
MRSSTDRPCDSGCGELMSNHNHETTFTNFERGDGASSALHG